jgi:hypothetical protein
MRVVRLHFYAVTLASTIALHAFAKHAVAQDHHHPAGLETQLHEKFYSTWFMPDEPTKSCCNKADCYFKMVCGTHAEERMEYTFPFLGKRWSVVGTIPMDVTTFACRRLQLPTTRLTPCSVSPWEAAYDVQRHLLTGPAPPVVPATAV